MRLALLLLPSATRASFAILDPTKFEALMTSLPEVDGWTGARAYDWAVAEAPFVDVDDADVLAASRDRAASICRSWHQAGRGDAAAATWIVRRKVAARLRPRRG